MISITDKAAAELGRLLKQKAAAPGQGLRLGVKRGGCAGWQYVMEIGEPAAGDEILDAPDARVIVAADSIARLDGCQVDYSDSLSDAGFRIENPRAARSCGCGTSFEPAGEPAPEPSEVEDCGKS